MLDQSYYRKADEIIEHYGRTAASLIPIMQDIQAEYRYLPGELLTYVAKEIGELSARIASPLPGFGLAVGAAAGAVGRAVEQLVDIPSLNCSSLNTVTPNSLAFSSLLPASRPQIR